MQNNIVAQQMTISPEAQSMKNIAIQEMALLDQLKAERKKAREALLDSLSSDEDYNEKEFQAKQAKKSADTMKKELMQDSHNYDLKLKIEALNERIKEARTKISDYLVAYENKSGQLSFLDNGGNKVIIAMTAKPKIVKIDTRNHDNSH